MRTVAVIVVAAVGVWAVTRNQPARTDPRARLDPHGSWLDRRLTPLDVEYQPPIPS